MIPKILIVLSSHEKLGDTSKKTGWHLREFAHPYYKLESKAGVVVASPKGGAAPLDESSVSAICHGPVVFGDVKLSDGSYLMKDQEMTGFTNEEGQTGLSRIVPFLLETKLRDNGAKFVKVEPWAAYFV
ncbi:hypothetical protein LTR49_028156 [Elasticomyces elasticus]|nr:hypothetical protein LTR49_028156 [Elasticomyces elasticus]